MPLSWLTARDSITSNPLTANVTTNSHGADFAWAIFAVQAVVFLGLSAYTFFAVNRGHRTFNYLVAATLACNTLNWYALASNLFALPVTVEFRSGDWTGHGNGAGAKATRSVWLPRYIDWLISTPFVIIATLLVSPVPLSTIFMTVFIETVAVICGLAGVLTPSSYKWGWFIFGVLAMCWVLWVLFGPALLAAKKAGKDVFWAYIPVVTGFGVWTLCYIIAWGVADAGNNISPDGEFIYYGVLDLLAKSLCLSYHVFAVSGVDYERFGLFSSKASIFASPEAAPGVAAPGPDDAPAAPATTKEAEQPAESA